MNVAAVELTGPVAQIVAAAAGLTALEVIRRKALAPLWRFYRWLRHEVRDEIKRRKAIDDLLQRELTPNGGSSMKDTTTRAANAVGEAVAAARRAESTALALKEQVAEVQGSQETIFELLDNVVDRKAQEHAEIWQALAEHGIDRRKPNPGGTT